MIRARRPTGSTAGRHLPPNSLGGPSDDHSKNMTNLRGESALAFQRTRADTMLQTADFHDRAFGYRLRVTRIALGITEAPAAPAATVDTWRKYEATERGHCTLAMLRSLALRCQSGLDPLGRTQRAGEL